MGYCKLSSDLCEPKHQIVFSFNWLRFSVKTLLHFDLMANVINVLIKTIAPYFYGNITYNPGHNILELYSA